MSRILWPYAIGATSMAIQFTVAVQLLFVGRAPGWHRARAFAMVAFTAALYSGNFTLGWARVGTLQEQAVFWLFALVFGVWHAAAWCRFAWAPDARSWGDAPSWLQRTVFGVGGLVVAVALSGRALDLEHPARMYLPTMGIDHPQPRTSMLGMVAMLAMGGLFAIAAAGLTRRRREPGYGLVLAGFGVFATSVCVEAAIAHFGVPWVFPAPVGFLAAIAPVAILLQRQFAADAERLAWLSSSLRGQLASRTAERDIAREALVRQEQVASVGRLANGVGHQLSNPVQHVTLALGELQRLPLANTPESAAHLRDIEVSVRRIEEVGRRLRDLTDLEPHHEDAFDLTRALQTAVVLTAPTWQGQVELRATYDHLGFALVGDEHATVRALAAVLVNAFEASARGAVRPARVTLHLGLAVDGSATVDVRDTGPGFPAEVLAHVGEPFLPGGTTLGLGLHSVHRIVHAHGGTVTVGNLPSGGALVSLVFPAPVGGTDRVTPGIATVPVARAVPSADYPHITPTILVVDDEVMVLQAFVRLLERQGYRVVSAEDGREAVARLAQEPVDLVITDLMMPNMSGVELAQHLATHYPALRDNLIVVCGGAVTRDAVQFIDTPGLRVLEKPVSSADLLRMVQELLPARTVASTMRAD